MHVSHAVRSADRNGMDAAGAPAASVCAALQRFVDASQRMLSHRIDLLRFEFAEELGRAAVALSRSILGGLVALLGWTLVMLAGVVALQERISLELALLVFGGANVALGVVLVVARPLAKRERSEP